MTAETLPIDEAPPAGSSSTQALTEALRGHYLRPGEVLPGGVFLTELTDDQTARRVDALHIGFWASAGRRINGHEVKVSRADWLRELADPGKAGPWFDRCHCWWLVVPSTAVARPDELPEGWGLMVPGTRGRRFKVVVRAAEREPRVDLPFLQILAKRLDSDRGTALAKEERAIREAQRHQLWAEHLQRQVTAAGADDTARRLKTLADLEAAFGQSLSTWSDGGYLATKDAAEALRAFTAWQQAERKADGLLGHYDVRRVDGLLADVAGAVERLAAAADSLRSVTG